MGLTQDVRKIFEELDAEDLTILGIMARERRKMFPYDIWKKTIKVGEPVHQRTVYGKIEKLVETKHIVKTKKEDLKDKRDNRFRQFHELTLKGLLAALATEKVSLDDSLVKWLGTELHIPKTYEKAVKPVVSIWAYCESRVSKSERGKVDPESIFQSIIETLAAWKEMGHGAHTIQSKRLELPPASEFREQLGITEEEYKILNMFVSTVLTFRLPAKVELGKRTLAYGSGVAPTPWLADCIEILPDFAIRVFWSPSEFKKMTEVPNYQSWFQMHKKVAALVSQGNQSGLGQYLMEIPTKLQFSCMPTCFKREYDGICKDKKIACPYGSPLECEIVRENAKKFEDFLDLVIKSWSGFKS